MSALNTFRVGPTVAALIMAAALAACSSSAGDAAAPPAVTSASSSTPSSAPSSTPASTPSGDGCDSATAAEVSAALKSYPQVTAVQVNGGCHQVSIQTDLPPTDPMTPGSEKAVAICKAAAKVAYRDETISGVTVAWFDRHEAAAGLKDSDCIPG